MKIKDNIKKIRLEKGMTQDQFAEVLHLDPSVISKIEKGERVVKADDLIKFAKLIGEDVTYFYCLFSTGQKFSWRRKIGY